MRKAVWTAVAVALMGLPAGEARADILCAPSSPAGFHACADFTVAFDAVSRQLVVSVRNVDLFAVDEGFNPAGWGYAVTGFGILSPSIAGPVSLVSVATSGVVEVMTHMGQEPADDWAFSSNIDGIVVQAGTSAAGVNGGIIGCYGEFGNTWFRTCDGGVSNTGWVVFTFQTEMTSFDVASVEWGMRAQGNGVSYRCTTTDTTNPDCVQFTTTPTTVPEPISMVLLGSGLLGIGGVNLRRRRRSGTA